MRALIGAPLSRSSNFDLSVSPIQFTFDSFSKQLLAISTGSCGQESLLIFSRFGHVDTKKFWTDRSNCREGTGRTSHSFNGGFVQRRPPKSTMEAPKATVLSSLASQTLLMVSHFHDKPTLSGTCRRFPSTYIWPLRSRAMPVTWFAVRQQNALDGVSCRMLRDPGVGESSADLGCNWCGASSTFSGPSTSLRNQPSRPCRVT
jgi:hypothetical protein